MGASQEALPDTPLCLQAFSLKDQPEVVVLLIEACVDLARCLDPAPVPATLADADRPRAGTGKGGRTHMMSARE